MWFGIIPTFIHKIYLCIFLNFNEYIYFESILLIPFWYAYLIVTSVTYAIGWSDNMIM
jgi:hypothetical protein